MPCFCGGVLVSPSQVSSAQGYQYSSDYSRHSGVFDCCSAHADKIGDDQGASQCMILFVYYLLRIPGSTQVVRIQNDNAAFQIVYFMRVLRE